MKFVELLDIEDCESAIIGSVSPPRINKDDHDGRWHVNAGAFVKLSDCSRWIQWELFSGYGRKLGYNLAKIDKAISILTKVRDEMAKNQKKYLAMKKEAEENNSKLKTKKRGLLGLSSSEM